MSHNTLAAAAAFLFSLLIIDPPAADAQSVLDLIKSRGVLVVATDPDWPPASWRKEDGQRLSFERILDGGLARTDIFGRPIPEPKDAEAKEGEPKKEPPK